MHDQEITFLLLAMAVVSFAAAVLVYSGRPRHPSNRFLALALYFQAMAEAMSAINRSHGLPDVLGAAPDANRVVFHICVLSLILSYFLFLSTLRTPLARLLAARPVRGAAVLSWSVAVVWTIVRPTDILSPVPDTPPSFVIVLPLVLVSVYGLLVALQMWQQTPPGGLARRQAFMFLLAFGLRDLALVLFGLSAVFATFYGIPAEAGDVLSVVPPAANTLSALLLTYGILSTQLLDIDLRLKWTLNRGTLMALFLAVFIGVSEVVSEVVTERAGLTAGIVATVLLVFAIGPLQRFADRISDTAMPGVRDTTEYRTVRKQEVYAAAVRSALEDGVITDRERSVLATLTDQLGLSASEALTIERETLSTTADLGGERSTT